MNLPEFPQILRKYAVKAPGHNQDANQNKAIDFRISSGWSGPKVVIYPEILVNREWIKVVYDGQALICALSRMLSPTRENQVKQAFTEFMKDWFMANNLVRKGSKDKKKEKAGLTAKALEDKKRKEKRDEAAKEKKEQREAEIARYKASLERQDSGSGTNVS
jgi:hypothetical protein